ncbi:MAG: 16S rRNA (cytidine(1402)-2'-O)-methyltransferase [Pseudomonadota bacterium]
MPESKGTLYIVATPIGNLADITRRAEEVLGRVDLIAAEDTRHSRKLLDALGIISRMISYREHNRESAGERILEEIRRGKDVALITDAGTPGVSDPGHFLVGLCVRESIKVVPVPGASAVTALLSASGMEMTRFLFQGFLPPKEGARTAVIEDLTATGLPFVIYESPNRILATMGLIERIAVDRGVVLGREMTKLHEEFIRGTAREVARALSKGVIKGEVAILVEGGEKPKRVVDLKPAVKKLREEGLSASKVASVLSQITGEDRKVIYQMASEE